MRQQGHFGGRERTQVQTLIADLDRIAQILDADIEFQEREAGVADLTCSEYPVPARALRARRDNLSETISALQSSLAKTGD